VDKTGASPLYLACERGNTEVVELLLSRGANLNMEATDTTNCPKVVSHPYSNCKLPLCAAVAQGTSVMSFSP